jgi:hypothetical protein
MLPLAPQKSHCFCPIRRDVQVDRHLGVFKHFPREPNIAKTIFIYLTQIIIYVNLTS